MKKILSIFLISFLILLSKVSHSQTTISANKMNVINTIILRGQAIDTLSTDTTFGANSNDVIPTQKAIKTYIAGQLRYTTYYVYPLFSNPGPSSDTVRGDTSQLNPLALVNQAQLARAIAAGDSIGFNNVGASGINIGYISGSNNIINLGKLVNVYGINWTKNPDSSINAVLDTASLRIWIGTFTSGGGGGGGGKTIYTGDSSLAGNRTITLNSYTLTLSAAIRGRSSVYNMNDSSFRLNQFTTYNTFDSLSAIAGIYVDRISTSSTDTRANDYYVGKKMTSNTAFFGYPEEDLAQGFNLAPSGTRVNSHGTGFGQYIKHNFYATSLFQEQYNVRFVDSLNNTYDAFKINVTPSTNSYMTTILGGFQVLATPTQANQILNVTQNLFHMYGVAPGIALTDTSTTFSQSIGTNGQDLQLIAHRNVSIPSPLNLGTNGNSSTLTGGSNWYFPGGGIYSPISWGTLGAPSSPSPGDMFRIGVNLFDYGMNWSPAITNNDSLGDPSYIWNAAYINYLNISKKANFPAATASLASINIATSGGTNPTTPSSGDLWWNGTNLYFYNGSTNKDLLAGGGMTNPMTTAADMIVGGAAGVPTRLGVGSSPANSVLQLISGTPTWGMAMFSSSYTPTVTLTNAGSGGVYGSFYYQVGTFVHVGIRGYYTPSNNTSQASVQITLPINASNLATTGYVEGTGMGVYGGSSAGQLSQYYLNTISNSSLTFITVGNSVTTGSVVYNIEFTYSTQ